MFESIYKIGVRKETKSDFFWFFQIFLFFLIFFIFLSQNGNDEEDVEVVWSAGR